MNDIYFYGIDFKKINLYCKIKIKYIRQIIELYKKTLNYNLDLKSDYFYEVYKIDFEEELVDILCYCKKNDNYKYVKLAFYQIEFSYFFEKIKESELNELII